MQLFFQLELMNPQEAVGDGNAACYLLYLLSGGSEPEVHRLLRAGVSGRSGWKNGEFVT